MSGASSPRPCDAAQEKAIAAANHRAKTFAVSKNAADDMIRILSTSDARLFSLSSPADAAREESGDEEGFSAAEDVIRRCDSSSSDMADYLFTVDDALAAVSLSGDLAARAAAAVHAAMPRLEEELRLLLCSPDRRLSLSSDDLDATPDVSPYPDALSPHPDALSPRAASSLRSVGDRMLRAGYGPELAQVYVVARRDALAESVAHLGVEAITIEEVLKLEWAALDQKIRRWNKTIMVVVKTLLAGERRLCEEVFASEVDLGDDCFADVTRGCVLQLLGFADAVAMSARATEKLYRMLGMYEALANVKPDLEELFSGDAREFVADEVRGVVAQLGATLRRTIEEFSSAIQGETSRPVHGGEIHPMTRYVLNYCSLLADYRRALDMVLDDALDGAQPTPSGRCMHELLTHLLANMDKKSKLYDDAGLQNVFLLNNLHYITQKVRDIASLRELVGDDWIRHRRAHIRQCETGYLRASWTTVLSYLRDDIPSSAPTSTYKAMLRDKARNFNAAFEELYRNQTSWKVSDPQLREELRIAVSERLIPAYRSFLGRATLHLETGRHSTRHIKHSLEDLEAYMLDFFEGVQKLVK